MENQKQGNGLKIATWVFIVLTELLKIAIIVTIIVFVLNLLAYLGLR